MLKRAFRRKGRQESSVEPTGTAAAQNPPTGTPEAPQGVTAHAAAPGSPARPAEQHRPQPTLYTPSQDVLPGRPLLRHPVGPLQPTTALPTASHRAPGSTRTPADGPQPDVSPAFPPVFPSAPTSAPSPAAGRPASDDDSPQHEENTTATASMALSELTRLFGTGPASGPAAKR